MAAVPGSRALIVDDDEVVRLTLARVMQKAGYLVAFVGNAREAIAAICADKPDIVFTDVFMPETDGFELMNWLRRSKSSIPLVAMSAANKALTGQLGLAAKLGAKATISKPFREQDVLEAIAAAATADRKAQWPGRQWD